jgi:hypothetical protein
MKTFWEEEVTPTVPSLKLKVNATMFGSTNSFIKSIATKNYYKG